MKRLTFAALSVVLSTSASAASAPPQLSRCTACHAVTRDADPGIGPTLYAVGGTKAASRPGYAYSAALKKSNIVWTKAMLERFIANPASAVPGTTMPNPNIANPADRAAIAAYLATLK